MEKKGGSLERLFWINAFWRKAKIFREVMLSRWLRCWGSWLLVGGAVYTFPVGACNWSFFPIDDSSVGLSWTILKAAPSIKTILEFSGAWSGCWGSCLFTFCGWLVPPQVISCMFLTDKASPRAPTHSQTSYWMDLNLICFISLPACQIVQTNPSHQAVNQGHTLLSPWSLPPAGSADIL